MLSQLLLSLSLGVLIVCLIVWGKVRRARKQIERREVQILQRARRKALKTIASAEILRDNRQAQMRARLQEISAGNLRKFEETVSNISKDVKAKTLTEVAQFRQTLLEQARQEIQAYKSQEVQKVTQKLPQIIRQVIYQVAGKSISLTDQEQLVYQALADAQKQNFF